MTDDNPESSKEGMSTSHKSPNPKQAIAIILVAVVLWVPMICFIFFYRQGVSPRQIAAIGAVNLFVGVSVLVIAYRKWIRNLK